MDTTRAPQIMYRARASHCCALQWQVVQKPTSTAGQRDACGCPHSTRNERERGPRAGGPARRLLLGPRTVRPAGAVVRSTAVPLGGSQRCEGARNSHLRHRASRHQRQATQHGRAVGNFVYQIGTAVLVVLIVVHVLSQINGCQYSTSTSMYKYCHKKMAVGITA